MTLKMAIEEIQRQHSDKVAALVQERAPHIKNIQDLLDLLVPEFDRRSIWYQWEIHYMKTQHTGGIVRHERICPPKFSHVLPPSHIDAASSFSNEET